MLSVLRQSTIGFALLLTTIWFEIAVAGEERLVSPQQEGQLLGAITVTTPSFNPSLGQTVSLQVVLKQDSALSVSVYDPDRGLVATLAEALEMQAGEHTLAWDGKTAEGDLVPDEAYFFAVTAQGAEGAVEVYDPTTFSGGVEQDLTEAALDRDAGTITYRLPTMSRVRIRLGISGGPLLHTLVDWAPRPAGQVTDYWNGKDKDGLFDMAGNPRMKMIISYFDLPESSVIAFGNKTRTYRDYKMAGKRPLKPERARIGDAVKISRHYQTPRLQDGSPGLTMTFPQQASTTEYGIPVLNGKSVVHVELDDASRAHFQNTKFEIVFFLNGEFYAEEESGYSPYNWVWDTTQGKEGTYILTVNLTGFQDQIGILSRKVQVVK